MADEPAEKPPDPEPRTIAARLPEHPERRTPEEWGIAYERAALADALLEEE